MKKEKRNIIILAVGIYFFSIFCFWLNGKCLTNSDSSSEFLLARLLNREHKIVSANWIYGTEIKILHNQLIYKICLYLINDWHIARTCSVIILVGILFSSYIYLVKSIGVLYYGLFIGCLLLMPISDIYMRIILYGLHYIPCVSIMFIQLGIMSRIIGFQNKGELRLCIVGIVLAFLSGLGGIRQMLTTYIPMLLTMSIFYMLENKSTDRLLDLISIQKNKSFFLGIIFFLSNFTGYAINSFVLHDYFTFQNYNNTSLSQFNLMNILNFIFSSFYTIFGYSGCNDLTSREGIGAIAGFVLCMLFTFGVLISLLWIKRASKVQQYFILYFIVSLFCNGCFCVLSGLTPENYMIPSAILAVPVLAISVNMSLMSKLYKKLLMYSILLCAVTQSISVYFYQAIYEHGRVKPALEDIAEWLVENNYKKGYATFWNSNCLVEFSNGELEIWTLQDSGTYGNSREWWNLKKYDVLEEKSHLYMEPGGQIFLVLSQKEMEVPESITFANEKYKVYQNIEYAVFAYKNQEELHELAKDNNY